MKISRIFFAAVFTGMLIMLTGCGKEPPENKAEEFITAFKEGRFSDMTPMLVQGENNAEQLYMPENADSRMLFEHLSKNLDYSLKKVDVDGNRATVTYEMTNTDMNIVMDRFLNNYFKKVLEADKGDGKEPDFDLLFTEAMEETIGNAETEKKTSTVNIKLIYTDEGWLVSDDWVIFDGLMGGYVSFALNTGTELSGLMAGTKADKGNEENNEKNTAETTAAAVTAS